MSRPRQCLPTGPMVRLLRRLAAAQASVDPPPTGTLAVQLRGLMELGLAEEQERDGRRVYTPTKLGQRVLDATRSEVK